VLKHALVGFDGSDSAHDALALGGVLTEASGATLTVAGVLTWEASFLAGRALPGSDGEGNELLAHIRTELEAAARSVGGRARMLRSTSAAHGLHDLALDSEADLLVLGSSSRGTAGRVLAGGVGHRLLNGAPCGVVVAPIRYRRRYAPDVRVIGVGYDGSAEAQAALERAAALALQLQASLRLVGVTPVAEAGLVPPWLVADDTRQLRRRLLDELEGRLDAALARLPAELAATGSVVSGSPAGVLHDKAGLGFDLLALGSRGYGTLRSVLLGSVSSDLVSSAPCPVVVYPRSAVDVAAGTPHESAAA
jgi:nucleotide-binding universal stress UspA family protein